MKRSNRATGNRFSVMTAFNLISLVILIVGGAVISGWVSRQIELRVLSRVGHSASLFAGSVVADEVDRLVQASGSSDSGGSASPIDLQQLGPDIAAIKIWNADGGIIWSSDSDEIGRQFEIEEGLEVALGGVVSTEISALSREEHELQRRFGSRLVETYAPVRRAGTGEIIAVMEFYQDADAILAEISGARWQTWALVGTLVVAIYLGLVVLFRRANSTIRSQAGELGELNARLRRAAIRTTTLNEDYLRRIAAELHDGPAQDIGYALLNAAEGSPNQTILRRGLEEIRHISAGLRTPMLESLSLAQVVSRAVSIHKNRTGCDVRYTCLGLPNEVHLATKITVFRVLQEALANAFTHAGDRFPTATVAGEAGEIAITVEDRCDQAASTNQADGAGRQDGPVHPAGKAGERAHLGIAVMRERVELLGGRLQIDRRTDGTVVIARIPSGGRGEEMR